MKEIKARKGYYLTQVGNVGTARIYITAIKGANIREEDWREATEAEKQDYEAKETKKEEGIIETPEDAEVIEEL
jgi:hypothetical protein